MTLAPSKTSILVVALESIPPGCSFSRRRRDYQLLCGSVSVAVWDWLPRLQSNKQCNRSQCFLMDRRTLPEVGKQRPLRRHWSEANWSAFRALWRLATRFDGNDKRRELNQEHSWRYLCLRLEFVVVTMADNPPLSNWDKPRRSSGYGGSREMPWRNGDSRETSWRSNSNGGAGAFDRRGFADARKPYHQNGHRIQNNHQPTSWQQRAMAPAMTWRGQGRPSNPPEYVSGDSSGRQPYSTETRPSSEMGGAWRSSRDKGDAPARVLAAYSHVGVEDEGSLATSIDGTCQDMCPVREREQRQRLRDLALFERINGNMARTSATLAVKKFCRTMTVAELQPSDIRPQHVLWETLQYLMRMLDRSDYTFESVHAFLFDRTRAVRQELGMQCIANSQAITMFEEIVRFHIMSERELQEQKAAAIDDPNSQLNFQQLSKSLLTLLNLYSAVDADGRSGWPNEAEFHGYYVLLNLGDRDQFKAEPLSLWFRSVRPRVSQTPDFMYARRVLRCYRSDNYKGFFDLARKASYLQGWLMELYFGEMRSVALKAINFGGYRVHPHLVADLAQVILMKEGDTEELCKAHGLTTSTDKDHNMSLITKQASFCPSKQAFRRQSSLISRKRAPTLFEEIAGERTDIER